MGDNPEKSPDQLELELELELELGDNPEKSPEQRERERIFKFFDANSDGKISAEELGDALKTLGKVTDDDVKRMMAEIDADGDGFITFKEFTVFALANRGLVKDVAKIF